MLSICQSCNCSLVGCQLWHFIDTNDYFGCPSYSPFEIPDIPEPEDVPASPQGLGTAPAPEFETFGSVLELPF